MNPKTLGFLGLLRRGGRLELGESLRDKPRKCALILLATDAKESTKKHFHDKAGTYHIPVIETGTKEELGQAIGFAECSALGIKDAKAAKKITLLEKGDTHEETPISSEEK